MFLSCLFCRFEDGGVATEESQEKKKEPDVS